VQAAHEPSRPRPTAEAFHGLRYDRRSSVTNRIPSACDHVIMANMLLAFILKPP
jgi:hypothetical protein